MDAGGLVPDDVIIEMVEAELAGHDAFVVAIAIVNVRGSIARSP